MEDRAVKPQVGVWAPVLFGALAGGMGWGIRGQYGHETGATMAGLLVCLTLAYLLAPRAHPLGVLRAVAWGAVGMGIGGSMTYGQTNGLTHDAELVGNWDALRWGLLGLGIKGAIWIGFGGLLFGMGMSGYRYRPFEILTLMLAMVGLFFMGTSLINSPFEPAERSLPWIYFSDDWYWEPGKEGLEPRPELWGGLLLALLGGIGYVWQRRGDRLARNLALWGMAGGAVGFPLGQSIQAYNAWNREAVAAALPEFLAGKINWWNMMETTFGAVMAAALGLGLWLNRDKIDPKPAERDDRLSPGTELLTVAIHLAMLIMVVFVAIRWVDSLYDLGLIMAIIPLTCIAGGRLWPYWQILPLTLLPIAGKTVRNLTHESGNVTELQEAWGAGAFTMETVRAFGVVAGEYLAYFIVPMLAFLYVVRCSTRVVPHASEMRSTVRGYLLLTAWTYFLLNWAFFHYPWIWQEWTGRTPNGVIFTVCVLGLTVMCFFVRPQERDAVDSDS